MKRQDVKDLQRDVPLGKDMITRDILLGKDTIDAPPSKERCVTIMTTEKEVNENEITQEEGMMNTSLATEIVIPQEKVSLHKEEVMTNISLVTEIVIPQKNQRDMVVLPLAAEIDTRMIKREAEKIVVIGLTHQSIEVDLILHLTAQSMNTSILMLAGVIAPVVAGVNVIHLS